MQPTALTSWTSTGIAISILFGNDDNISNRVYANDGAGMFKDTTAMALPQLGVHAEPSRRRLRWRRRRRLVHGGDGRPRRTALRELHAAGGRPRGAGAARRSASTCTRARVGRRTSPSTWRSARGRSRSVPSAIYASTRPRSCFWRPSPVLNGPLTQPWRVSNVARYAGMIRTSRRCTWAARPRAAREFGDVVPMRRRPPRLARAALEAPSNKAACGSSNHAAPDAAWFGASRQSRLEAGRHEAPTRTLVRPQAAMWTTGSVRGRTTRTLSPCAPTRP